MINFKLEFYVRETVKFFETAHEMNDLYILCTVLSTWKRHCLLYINWPGHQDLYYTEICCNNTPSSSWWIQNQNMGILKLNSTKVSMTCQCHIKCQAQKPHNCPNINLSISLQKDQHTLHTLNSTNANIMSSQMCLFTIYWLHCLNSVVLWLAFSSRDSI